MRPGVRPRPVSRRFAVRGEPCGDLTAREAAADATGPASFMRTPRVSSGSRTPRSVGEPAPGLGRRQPARPETRKDIGRSRPMPAFSYLGRALAGVSDACAPTSANLRTV
jgi:hypothetical protein